MGTGTEDMPAGLLGFKGQLACEFILREKREVVGLER